MVKLELLILNPLMNVLLIADDPAYPHIISKWSNSNLILMRKKEDSHMPLHYRYIDSSIPSVIAIGLKKSDL